MLRLLVAAGLYALALASLVLALPHTYELKVHRPVGSTECTHARIRHAQLHRGLAKQDVTTGSIVATSHDGKTTLEYLSAFAYEEDVLRRELATLCSNANGIELVMPAPVVSDDSGSQAVLSSTGTSAGESEVEVPPFEVRLIAGSGPSDNRVDLTFFSDGCEHIWIHFTRESAIERTV